MDNPTPPTPPTPKPYIAGLPDAPLERPSDFPDYDGPLVCPFYGPGHPARRDEESKEAFNEDVARVAFGDAEFERARLLQSHKPFAGDWWLLTSIHYSVRFFASPEIAQRLKDVPAEAWRRCHMQMPPRAFAHLEHADLRNMDLEYMFAPNAHLEHARFERSRLQHAALDGATLNHADFHSANLASAQFHGTAMHKANLHYATLSGANLSGADLTGAEMYNAMASGAHFTNATLESASLRRAILDSALLMSANCHCASFQYADMSKADLSGANLQRANLLEANLDEANLRWAIGCFFNDNAVRRLNIQGNAKDPWSVLRRTYTGPMFFVHLLLLVAFLLPYAAKVLTLTTTARSYDAIRQALEAAGGVPLGGEVVRSWLANFDATHAQTPALWVLLGGTHGIWWAMVPTALAIVAYNLLRGYLTLTIGVMRDQADRVERTPAIEEYMGLFHPMVPSKRGFKRFWYVWGRRILEWWVAELAPAGAKRRWRWRSTRYLNPLPVIGPWRLHLLARVLFWISIASVILHVGSWLWTTTVPVPK